MTELPPGLAEWARLAGPTVVLTAVRERAVRGFNTERGTVRCELSEKDRREVGRLLGNSWVLSGKPVRLQHLALVLADHGLSVRQLVEAIGGPIDDLREQRAEAAATADAERAQAAVELTAVGIASEPVDTWVRSPGLPRAGSGELLELARQVAAVWRLLPGVDGVPVSLARLAAQAAGNAHALDDDTALGRAVARLAAAQRDEPTVRGARAWRAAWTSVGVRCDEVSSRVLVVNLPLTGDAAAVSFATCRAGEPVWLTLRSLSGELTIATGITVFVCENVTVAEAAAERLGSRCPPLVCTDGIPSLAAVELLRVLADAECELHVRTDVDAAGFTIIRQIWSIAPEARLWRFDSATYARAIGAELDLVGEPNDRGHVLERIQTLYAEIGRPLHEEEILDQLLADLAGLPSVTTTAVGPDHLE